MRIEAIDPVRLGKAFKAGPKNRRHRVGYAPVGARLERGTISRAVRCRRPDLDEGEGSSALAAVGLAKRVATLPEGEGTSLRRGGEPLSRQEIPRLWVARAVIGPPPLLRRLLAGHPGIVLVASDQPERFLDDWREWGPGPP